VSLQIVRKLRLVSFKIIKNILLVLTEIQEFEPYYLSSRMING